jgi:hypothetical protein
MRKILSNALICLKPDARQIILKENIIHEYSGDFILLIIELHDYSRFQIFSLGIYTIWHKLLLKAQLTL